MSDSKPQPGRALFLLHLAALAAAALLVATLGALLVPSAWQTFPRSLVFSATLLVVAWAGRLTVRGELRDRAVSAGAVASVGAAPFVAFCAERALTVPTSDARPLEGTGTIVVGLIALFLLVVGPLVLFVGSIPLALHATRGTRLILHALALLAVVGAGASTLPAISRRLRFPDPDGYLLSLPVLAQVAAGCPAARCVRCPAGAGPRPFTLVSSAGERELGPVEAPCDQLVFRHEPVLDLVLVSGDPDHGATLRSWSEVGVYAGARSGRGERSVWQLRERLAAPLGWIVEAGVGVVVAVGCLLLGLRRSREEASPVAGDARATAHAALAFAAAVLFATPLWTAWYVSR